MNKIYKIVLGCCLLSTTVMADQITLTLENDVLHSTDKYYTHGTKLQYEKSDGYGVILGQNIYTPLNKDAKEPQPDQRPYAGWLYTGLSLNKYTNNVDDYYEFTVGVVGPDSYAEQTQKQIHRWINDDLPQGWDNQLHDEFVANVYYCKTYHYELASFSDVLPYGEIIGGSVYDGLGMGTDMRLGYNLPPSFEPEINVKAARSKKFMAYIFAGVNGRWVMHNMFLDGNNYRNSHDAVTVDKEPLVGEFRNGAAVGYGDIELRFTDFYRTKEYTTQDESTWNSALSLVVRF